MEKTPQIHLIIIREWPNDNFPPGAFYSAPYNKAQKSYDFLSALHFIIFISKECTTSQLSMFVRLWEYCAIVLLLQNLVYCFYKSMVLHCHCHCHILLENIRKLLFEFLMFSGEIERENWLEMGYVQQIFIPPGIFNKTIP